MKIFLYLTFALFIISGFSGCMTSTSDMSVENEIAERIPLPASSQIQAIQNEVDNEYLKALRYWKNAEKVIDDKLVFLSDHVQQISAEHLQNGVTYFLDKKGDEAFREFMEALRFDPSNIVALDYLKNRYEASRFVLYTVLEGDTLETIAEKMYGTFTSAFVVIYFSDLQKSGDLGAGLVLKLPLLDSFYSQALRDYEQNIIAARILFNDKNFEELLPLAESIFNNHPGDHEASYLVNISLLRIGNMLKSQEKFEDAAGILSRVDPAFKNVKKSILEIRELQKEKLLRDALLLNTGLFIKGEMLYAEGKYIEALEVFRQVDPEFEEVDKVVSVVRKKLQIQAEIHYKEGVKFFLEENLVGAIAEWEETLRYHPGHKEALNYIEKARKLLEKYKAIN